MWENMFQGLDESAIAADFAARVRDYVGPANYAALRRLNASGTLSPNCCASHDYCDSNVFLFAALCDAIPGLYELSETEETPWNFMDDMAPAWNRIHDIATRDHFTA